MVETDEHRVLFDLGQNADFETPSPLEAAAPSTATQAAGARQSLRDFCLRNLLESGPPVPGECPTCSGCVRLVD